MKETAVIGALGTRVAPHTMGINTLPCRGGVRVRRSPAVNISLVSWMSAGRINGKVLASVLFVTYTVVSRVFV